MISSIAFKNDIERIIVNAIREDVGEGDHSSLACIPENALGKARLIVKDKGVLADDFLNERLKAIKLY